MTPIFSKGLVASTSMELTREFAALRERGIHPILAAVVCSDDPAVRSYVASKQKTAEKLGVELQVHDFSDAASETELTDRLRELCSIDSVHGVILELPIRKGWDEVGVTNAIPMTKDVDGLSAGSLGLLMQDRLDAGVVPATPQACLLLAETVTGLAGKKVTLVGRGRTVGKPLANLLVGKGATVTVCHSKTSELNETISAADIVFLATGKPHFFDRTYFRAGQVIVDAGISFKDGKLCGDANLVDLADVDVCVTPVPGGVGPLTSILVFRNLLSLINRYHV